MIAGSSISGSLSVQHDIFSAEPVRLDRRSKYQAPHNLPSDVLAMGDKFLQRQINSMNQLRECSTTISKTQARATVPTKRIAGRRASVPCLCFDWGSCDEGFFPLVPWKGGQCGTIGSCKWPASDEYNVSTTEQAEQQRTLPHYRAMVSFAD